MWKVLAALIAGGLYITALALSATPAQARFECIETTPEVIKNYKQRYSPGYFFKADVHVKSTCRYSATIKPVYVCGAERRVLVGVVSPEKPQTKVSFDIIYQSGGCSYIGFDLRFHDGPEGNRQFFVRSQSATTTVQSPSPSSEAKQQPQPAPSTASNIAKPNSDCIRYECQKYRQQLLNKYGPAVEKTGVLNSFSRWCGWRDITANKICSLPEGDPSLVGLKRNRETISLQIAKVIDSAPQKIKEYEEQERQDQKETKEFQDWVDRQMMLLKKITAETKRRNANRRQNQQQDSSPVPNLRPSPEAKQYAEQNCGQTWAYQADAYVRGVARVFKCYSNLQAAKNDCNGRFITNSTGHYCYRR